jgi:competence protein ComEA
MLRHASWVDLHALTPTQRRLVAVVVLLGAVLVLGVPRLLHRGDGHGAIPPLRAPRSAPVSRTSKVVVDVAGAVRRPGLHALAPGMRIADAVVAAGGATAKADISAVNLAAPLADGEQIVVPARGSSAAGAAGAPGGGAPSPTAPLDLNTASLEQLDALPGIGPTTAQKILDYRQAHGSFHSVSELDAVPGIGQGRLEALKGLVLP